MSVVSTVSGTKTKVNHEFSGTTAKINKAYLSAAHHLFNLGRGDHGVEGAPKAWEDQSTQDKLDIVHDYLRQVVGDLARTYLINEAKQAAAEVGQTEYNETIQIT
jgi:hypothetical protein